MRIVCPTCSAAYDVADRLLVPGRAVRCARCGGQWAPAPAVTAAEPEPEEPPPPSPPRWTPPAGEQSPRLTAMDRLASESVPLERSSNALRAAWAVSLVVLLGLGWGVGYWRADLMRLWPPSTRLYDFIGLAPSPGR